MRKIILITIVVLIIGISGCSDVRLLPSDMKDTYYYQPEGSKIYYSIDFTDDNNGTLLEYDYDATFDPGGANEDKDFDYRTDGLPKPSESFNITGLDGTRYFTGATFSSVAGLTVGSVALHTFKTFGYVRFYESINYRIYH